MTQETGQWAATYASLGWRVFPIWPGDKRPLYDGWQKDATTDPKMVEQYWRPGTDRNIGVLCGDKFDAWDIEVAHVAKFEALVRANEPLPESPIARTGRGGLHILTAPTGVNATRYLYLDGEHVGELKSTGGFIVIAPSSTDKQGGGPYSWLWRPDWMAVQDAPQWMLGMLTRPRHIVHKFPSRIRSIEQGMRRLEALASAVMIAGEGKRNNYLYWAMRQAIEEGVPPKIAAQALLETGIKAGLEDRETKATLRSAYEAEGANALT